MRPLPALRSLPTVVSLALLLLAAGCSATPQPVTPQRPTFSSDTSTTAEGTVEVEAGIAIDPRDRFDTPVTVKYGTSDRTEVFASWSPYQWVELPGSNGRGVGDVSLGTRQRLWDETEEGLPSAAFQFSTKLPAADEGEGLGSGEIDFFGAAIVSKSFERFSTTGYYQMGFLGDPNGDDADIQHGAAFAVSTPFGDTTSLFGELAAVITPEADDEQLFTTLGVAQSMSDDFVLDVSIVVGLSPDAPDFQFLVGFTKNFGEIAEWFGLGSDSESSQP